MAQTPVWSLSVKSRLRAHEISAKASAVVNQRHLSQKCDLLGNAALGRRQEA
jgi:hypothetical protein